VSRLIEALKSTQTDQQPFKNWKEVIQIKKLLAIGAVALLGMVACVKPAQAQVFNFDLIQTDAGSGNGIASYHMVLTEVSPTAWHINSVVANGGVHTPGTDIERITVSFWADAGLTVGVAVTGGDTGSVAGAPAGAWTSTMSGNTYRYDDTTLAAPLKLTGTNTFSGNGNIVLAGSPGFIHIVGQDGHQYEATLTIVPEGSAMAMFLPGLLPLGLFLRKRFSARA
jgi:hypothetical protein